MWSGLALTEGPRILARWPSLPGLRLSVSNLFKLTCSSIALTSSPASTMATAPAPSPTFAFSVDPDFSQPAVWPWERGYRPPAPCPANLSPKPHRISALHHRRSRDSLLPSATNTLGLNFDGGLVLDERPQTASGALPCPAAGASADAPGACGETNCGKKGHHRHGLDRDFDSATMRHGYERKVSTTSLRTDYSSIGLSPAASIDSLRHTARVALGKALVAQNSRDRLRNVPCSTGPASVYIPRKSPSLANLRHEIPPVIQRGTWEVPLNLNAGRFGSLDLSPPLGAATGPSPAPSWQSTLDKYGCSPLFQSPPSPARNLPTPQIALPLAPRSPALAALTRAGPSPSPAPSPSLPALSSFLSSLPAAAEAALSTPPRVPRASLGLASTARKPRPVTIDFRRDEVFVARSLSNANINLDLESVAETTETPSAGGSGKGSRGKALATKAFAPLSSIWLNMQDARTRRPLGFRKRPDKASQLAEIAEDGKRESSTQDEAVRRADSVSGDPVWLGVKAYAAVAVASPPVAAVAEPPARPARPDEEVNLAASLTPVERTEISVSARNAKVGQWLSGLPVAGEMGGTDSDLQSLDSCCLDQLGEGDFSLVGLNGSFELSV